MPIPLASALELLRDPRARQENDQSAARELNVARQGLELPRGLGLRWLGTAGFAITYAGHTVLIDPYLTRPGTRAVFGRRSLRADAGLIARHVPSAHAVLVGHTHFDHALDVPEIARRHGAPVYGSRSAANLMHAAGLGHLAVRVEPHRTYDIGPFAVTFVPSLHSKLLLGLAVPYGGELTCDSLDALHGARYRCGDVFGIHIAVAGVSLYHQGSANLIEDQIRHRNIDCFLAGIAGRGFTRDYTARILRALSPRVIIPQHYDDFFRPLGAPMGFSLNVNLGGFVEEVRRVSRDFRVCTLEPLQIARGPD